MRVLCVDSDERAMKHTLALCGEHPAVDCANGFADARSALEWMETNRVELALLDVGLPDMNGIELAVRIKDKSPDTSIIFLTAYSEYAVEAFRLHASGYIMKPIDKETLAAEIKYALVNHPLYMYSRITVQTFGDFEVRVDGEILVFIKSKSKELLAYLIEKHGRSVSRLQAFMALYENREYDRSMQKQFDNVIRNLRNVLKEHGAEDIFVLERATMRIRPELIDCDMYRFLAGDSDAVNSYRGEYMNQYSWANMSEAYASRMKSDSR